MNTNFMGEHDGRPSISDYHLSNLKKGSGKYQLEANEKIRFGFVGYGTSVFVFVGILLSAIDYLSYSYELYVHFVIFRLSATVVTSGIFISLLGILLLVVWKRLNDAQMLDKALKRSSKWFSTTFKSIGAALLAADRDGNIIFMNPAAEKITGSPFDHVVGMPLSNICNIMDGDANNSDHYKKRIQQVLEGGVSFQLKEGSKLHVADGSELNVMGNATPIKDSNSEVIGVVLILHDITEYKINEKNRIKMAAVIEQADDAIVITDSRGIVEYVNPRFYRIMGYDPAVVIGKDIRTLKDSHYAETMHQDLTKTVSTKKVLRNRYTFTREDGSICQLESTISGVKDNDGRYQYYVIVSRDVTKEVELQHQLNHAQKMEALGTLAGGVAHDFNNILTVINGYTSFLLTEFDKASPLYEFALEISKAGDRATMLTRQLLACSRKDISIPIHLKPNGTISDMEKMLRRLIREDINLHLKLDPKVRQIKVDPGQLGQVVMNLVVNAADALPDGGDIALETANINVDTNTEQAGQPVKIKPGAYVKISISDNGYGMGEETQSRIFEPFFTTKEAGKGTGLGLAIVYGFIKAVSGEIRVESKLTIGTTFELYIPVNEEPSAKNDFSKTLEIISHVGKETILVVDDDKRIVGLIRRVLEKEGYNLLQANNGQEALDLSREHSTDIDLMLTDIVMPKMDGFKLAENMSKQRPQMKILYMTGYLDQSKINDRVEEIKPILVNKPFVPDQLLKRIRSQLDENIVHKAT